MHRTYITGPWAHTLRGRMWRKGATSQDAESACPQATPRYARCTCSLAATSADGPSSTTRPCSMTYTTWARVKAKRAFCSTSRIVTPSRFTSGRRRYTPLPAYALELNPAEYVWAQADHELAN